MVREDRRKSVRDKIRAAREEGRQAGMGVRVEKKKGKVEVKIFYINFHLLHGSDP